MLGLAIPTEVKELVDEAREELKTLSAMASELAEVKRLLQLIAYQNALDLEARGIKEKN